MRRVDLYSAITMLFVAAMWAASAVLYPRLPANIPTHWGIDGRVDGYGPRWVGLFLLPAFALGMLGLLRLLPVLSPKGFEVESFRPTYLLITAVVIGTFAYLHYVILLVTWQHVTKAAHPIDIARTAFAGIFLLLALTGNVLGKIRRNFYIGVRVPWTLASDRVWNDTHRLAAWTLVAGGLFGFLIAVTGMPLVIAFAALTVSALIPVVYSFVHYKQLERRGAL